jgi:hypothetical protein
VSHSVVTATPSVFRFPLHAHSGCHDPEPGSGSLRVSRTWNAVIRWHAPVQPSCKFIRVLSAHEKFESSESPGLAVQDVAARPFKLYDCLCKLYHGRATRDALRAWSDGGPVFHGEIGPAAPDSDLASGASGPADSDGRRGEDTQSAPRAGPTLPHRAAGPSGRRTDDADTHGWTWRPRAPQAGA